MPDTTPVLYEGLFLINLSAMSGDLSGAVEHVQEMLDRAEAETLFLNKWEERKLAYDIDGHKRGTFLIGYFKSRPTQIANIERDCNLSEQVSRVMFIRADHMGEAELEAAKEGIFTTKTAAVEGDQNDDPNDDDVDIDDE